MAFINAESLQCIPLIYLMTEWADRMCGYKASYINGDSSEWMNEDRWSVLRDWTLWMNDCVWPWRNIPNILHQKTTVQDSWCIYCISSTSHFKTWQPDHTRTDRFLWCAAIFRLSTQRQIGRKQRDGAKNTCKSRTSLWRTGSFFSRGRHLVASF